MGFGITINLIFFFLLFFILFTLIQRFIYRHLEKLLVLSKRGFFSNYIDLITTYLLLGIPITLILYYGSTFGDNNIIEKTFGNKTALVTFVTSFIVLVSIRLAILLKKRQLLRKIPLINKFDRLVPEIKSRKELKNEYKSYLFEIFLTTFMSVFIVILFNVLFLSEQTQISIKGYTGTIYNILNSFSDFISNNWYFGLFFFAIPFFSEILIKIMGVYTEFKEK